MNPSQKKTLVVVLVVVLAAVIIGAIAWSSQSNNTSPRNTASGTPAASSTQTQIATSWQTYTSKTVNISFSYPPGWSLGPNVPISIDNFNHTYQGDSIIPMGGAEIDIANTKYYGLLGDLIATETMGDAISATSTVSVDKTLCTEVSYGSSYAPGYPSSNIAVYCEYPGNGLLYKIYLSYRAHDPSGAQYLATFAQFLKSVQFTAP